MTQPAVQHKAYHRIVLKLSGEALAPQRGYGIDPEEAERIALRIRELHDTGVQIAIVIGGGNLWRGKDGVQRGMAQSTADHIGMIGTVMNGLALQDALERMGVRTRVQTAIAMNAIAEPYIRLRAVRHMEKGRVVIIAGGTGNPYFTTDSAAALRAMEMEADIIIKATKVDGVYSADPKKDPTATRYSSISYAEVIAKRLNVMDMTAFTMCQENHMPIMVLDFWAEGALMRAVQGDESVGTIIR
ncbi:MAG: UMP kinase [Pleurocapsa minor GSE-CHR-MK-17-07R]|jgi:uridylate kinase|nr:UMP kinase [Pleurocapsa minor GSE-CHR-MK 17-07R]